MDASLRPVLDDVIRIEVGIPRLRKGRKVSNGDAEVTPAKNSHAS
jgi:hypothetical protein